MQTLGTGSVEAMWPSTLTWTTPIVREIVDWNRGSGGKSCVGCGMTFISRLGRDPRPVDRGHAVSSSCRLHSYVLTVDDLAAHADRLHEEGGLVRR